MQVSDLDSTLFIVEFDDIPYKEIVKREGLWTFDKHLVLVSEVEGFQQVHQIKFVEAPY